MVHYFPVHVSSGKNLPLLVKPFFFGHYWLPASCKTMVATFLLVSSCSTKHLLTFPGIFPSIASLLFLLEDNPVDRFFFSDSFPLAIMKCFGFGVFQTHNSPCAHSCNLVTLVLLQECPICRNTAEAVFVQILCTVKSSAPSRQSHHAHI